VGTTWLRRLGLERRVGALALGLFVYGFGQELWFRYLPEYLRVLGASAFAVGAFGALKDLLDAVYAYPGGMLSNRLGSRDALLLFGLLSAAGFALYLFPVAVVLSHSFAQLVLAYVVDGLREIGEPARKALIVDLADPLLRGRTVGLYYSIRGFAVAGAAAIGGALWTVRPALTFAVAATLGALGTLLAAAFLPKSSSPRLAEVSP
jgi:Major Facilitator Superfamily